ncbi:hypothetical protein [Hymenobacter qilianensis]|uniref:Uncharacterized protein n=1 Tax=Hymenobacter qilianensis TaxID=1385715 RepID=A0A7H0H1X5_9BACT|nr:hypothetical protein [Hymenobacter qilianensis]QNP54541.1 hypothetical protein H9L05_22600 [Hymenobacter qilianensis]
MTDHANPRARMVQDLMAHHLRPGLPRAAVLALLGPPYKEGVENRLPKHITMPDTIGAIRPELYQSGNRAHLRAATLQASRRINAFYREHGRPDTLMLYPVGWSTIDPNFLVVQYTGHGRVKGYWVEQH